MTKKITKAYTTKATIDARTLKESFTVTVDVLKQKALLDNIALEDHAIAAAINITIDDFKRYTECDTAPEEIFKQLRATYPAYLTGNYAQIVMEDEIADPYEEEIAALHSIARYLLKDKAVEFERLLQELQKTPVRAFLEQQRDILERVVDVDYLLDDKRDRIEEVLLLLALAVGHQLVSVIDWSGEEELGDVRAAISHMLAIQNHGSFQWKNDGIEEDILALQPKRGEYLPLLFNALNAALNAEGFSLGHLNIGHDCYYYFVLPTPEFEQIVHLSGEGFLVMDVNTYEIYLLTAGEQDAKITLYLKNKLNIPLGEIKSVMEKGEVLVATGSMSLIKSVKRELAAIHGKYEIRRKG
ncbi:DUF6630 family protein [Chitinophaga qingshengii]|uniref:DUF6630 domain-containing protein n=1 Tax=Chitinophaga qingshengii TaxID=1569794 RepID=A0ABR7TSA2_9BACT|nr:hypothetical protein [Chitinophaga qingshengii]MBC9931854.1 hypothetical protein [Chitinophaga qingshengii]